MWLDETHQEGRTNTHTHTQYKTKHPHAHLPYVHFSSPLVLSYVPHCHSSSRTQKLTAEAADRKMPLIQRACCVANTHNWPLVILCSIFHVGCLWYPWQQSRANIPPSPPPLQSGGATEGLSRSSKMTTAGKVQCVSLIAATACFRVASFPHLLDHTVKHSPLAQL